MQGQSGINDEPKACSRKQLGVSSDNVDGPNLHANHLNNNVISSASSQLQCNSNMPKTKTSSCDVVSMRHSADCPLIPLSSCNQQLTTQGLPHAEASIHTLKHATWCLHMLTDFCGQDSFRAWQTRAWSFVAQFAFLGMIPAVAPHRQT